MKSYLALLIALIFLLSACASPSSTPQNSSMEVTNAWVRTAQGPGSNTALYMSLQNNSGAPDKLLKVESNVAEMIQIHNSSVDANGVSSMHEVDGVEVPAGGSAALEPGGYHVMLMGLKLGLQEGDILQFTLTFQNAGSVTIEAPVKTP